MNNGILHTANHVEWLRGTASYIHSHRSGTFVVSFGGETLSEGLLPHLVQDLSVLHSLGIRLVLVHGARPQIESRLRERHLESVYHQGLRVTDEAAMQCVREAASSVRLEIEALLSMGIAHSPMAGAHIRVCSGNFVTARPIGVRNGVDFGHTGEVRKIDHQAIRQILDAGSVALLSPLGYAPTGDVFNLSAEKVATAAAISLGADKLLLIDQSCRNRDGEVIPHMTVDECLQHLAHSSAFASGDAFDAESLHLQAAVTACNAGIPRTHLLDHHTDGSLLLELFTREGSGTLVSATPFETLRPATCDDIGGILDLARPLEKQGVLVGRSRERLEMEIGDYLVIERDGRIIGCAALHHYPEGSGEVASMVLHPDYRSGGRGSRLLTAIENQARQAYMPEIYVLTTHTEQWFQERGYESISPEALPPTRRQRYNPARNSRVLRKRLD
ncbi:MAG: hypothetical protein RIQ52_1173 [Pseudomonadota bacterium]